MFRHPNIMTVDFQGWRWHQCYPFSTLDIPKIIITWYISDDPTRKGPTMLPCFLQWWDMARSIFLSRINAVGNPMKYTVRVSHGRRWRNRGAWNLASNIDASCWRVYFLSAIRETAHFSPRRNSICVCIVIIQVIVVRVLAVINIWLTSLMSSVTWSLTWSLHESKTLLTVA